MKIVYTKTSRVSLMKITYERMMIMTPAVTTVENNSKTLYNVKDAMKVLFGKLDEAIDDIENGRTLTSEEMWNEIGKI